MPLTELRGITFTRSVILSSVVGSIFLAAEWRYLAMLNYQVDPRLLQPHVPPSTELDLFEGQAYVSLVGFRFLKTRVRGLRVPFHTDFDEVNLRFYVRFNEAGGVRRGVTFLREVVPRRAIAEIARRVYNEPYVCLPMRHAVELAPEGIAVDYRWQVDGAWNRMQARASGTPRTPVDGTLDQFIADHQWGYTAQRDGGTIEYEVTHPSWRLWTAEEAAFDGNAAPLYGPDFAEVLQRRPDSAFIAEGSAVTVSAGRRVA